MVAGVAIVVAGALLHFVYGWSSRNALVGLVSPVNESVWEHTKLLVVPLVVAGVVEAVLLRDVRRVAWAVLVESLLGALAIVAVFYTYTGAFGTGPVLWVDITTFILIVAGGQWVHLRVLASRRFPPGVVSVLGVLAVLALYAAFTVSPPDLPVFQPGSSVPAGPGRNRSTVFLAWPADRLAAGRDRDQ